MFGVCFRHLYRIAIGGTFSIVAAITVTTISVFMVARASQNWMNEWTFLSLRSLSLYRSLAPWLAFISQKQQVCQAHRTLYIVIAKDGNNEIGSDFSCSVAFRFVPLVDYITKKFTWTVMEHFNIASSSSSFSMQFDPVWYIELNQIEVANNQAQARSK